MADNHEVPRASGDVPEHLESIPESAASRASSPIREDSNTGPLQLSTNLAPIPESAVSRHPSPIRPDENITPTQLSADEEQRIFSLHRAGTLPIRQPAHEPDTSPAINGGRRRGRTISSRKDAQSQRTLSPRSQIFKRPSFNRDENSGEGRMGLISESGQQRRQRSSTNASRPSFTSPDLRPRMSTWGQSASRSRGGTINRRPTVFISQPTAVSSGREIDAQSMRSNNFSLAGPAPIETVAANQPYVDPGYSELNPAYDQPLNTRPVWGLAKPLPRVIRPGMVPTRRELNVQIPEQQAAQDQENADIEQGRVEPTLNLGKITSQLQNERARRENRLLELYDSRLQAPPTTQQQSQQPLSPGSQAIADDSDIGLSRSHQGDQPPYNRLPDDASSIATEKEDLDDLDGDWIGDHDTIPLKAYEAQTDEIHNLHTHWSVIRLRFREPLAELLAVTVQLTLGFSSDLVITLSKNSAGNEATTDWAWGLATMIGIHIAGGISGAHLNPAISIMLWIYRGFPLRKVPIYIFAQVLGAFIAALITFGLFRQGILDLDGTKGLGNGGTASAFITYPRHEWVSHGTAFATELVGTAILAVAVLALGDDTNAPPGAGMNAFILGLIITVLSMAFGYSTGAAMNGSRDLGPRLALLAVGYGGEELFGNGYWVYGPWVGTITGAVVGGLLYDGAIFVGGESPVNYPRKRFQRAGKKWKGRWAGRLRRGKQLALKRNRDEVDGKWGV